MIYTTNDKKAPREEENPRFHPANALYLSARIQRIYLKRSNAASSAAPSSLAKTLHFSGTETSALERASALGAAGRGLGSKTTPIIHHPTR